MIRSLFDEIAEVLVPEGRAVPVVLLADHASNHVPEEWAGLGLDGVHLDDHIGWDIGTDALTRAISRSLNCAAVVARFSRLIIDPNRDPDHPNLIPVMSDGIPIPANVDLSPAQSEARFAHLYQGYHRTCGQVIDRALTEAAQPLIIGIHSFTPALKSDAPPRPWEIGFLWGRDKDVAAPLIQRMRDRGLTVGDNEPYSGKELYYTMERHGTDRGLHNVSIEIRQDLLMTESDVARWCGYIVDDLTWLMASEPGLLKGIQHG